MRTLLRATLGLMVFAALLALLAGALSAPQAQQAPERKVEPFPGWFKRIDETHLDFTHYYTLEECEQTIDLFAQRFPELVSVETIGQSYQGRPLRVLTLCNSKTGAPDTKPCCVAWTLPTPGNAYDGPCPLAR